MNVFFVLRTLWQLRQLRKSDHWTRSELNKYQQERLKELREYACTHSPFYQEFHKGLESASLQELPVVTKRVMMENFDRFVTDHEISVEEVRQFISKGEDGTYLDKYWVNATAGSTGQPGIFLFDNEEWRTVITSFAKAQEWSGVKVNLLHRQKRAIVSSTALTHMSSLVGHTIETALMPTLRLDSTIPLEEIVRQLNEWQPEMLIAYASMARILAFEAKKGALRISPKVVFTSSEVLTQDTKKLVKEVWGEEPFNEFASTETATIAADCEFHRMHLFEDLIITEVVDENNQEVPEGEFGDKLLVTVLFSRTQPLIRYEISDSIRVSKKRCECGRPFHIVEEVQGRREDVLYFLNQEGKEATFQPNLFHRIMEDLPVSGWQIVRETDHLKVLLAGLPEFFQVSELEKRFMTLFQEQNTLPMPIEISRVQAIPKSKSGKAPLIKDTVKGFA